MASSSTQEKEINLLLLGKTGNGKSATGNTIIGRESFAVSSSAESETMWIQHACEYTRFKGFHIKVIDTPGFCDTGMGATKSNILIHDGIVKALLMCPEGFNALVVVLKYGTRFTEEERSTVATLKHIFGEGFVQKHGTLIFTHGELLDLQHKGRASPEIFEAWLRKQEGELAKLIRECGIGRCLLFRNQAQEVDGKQVKALLTKVISLERYTNDIFHRVGARRQTFIMQQKGLLLKGDAQKRYSFLEDSLKNAIKVLGKRPGATNEKIEHTFDILSNDAEQAEKAIEEIDRGLTVLKQMQLAARGVLNTTDNLKQEVLKGSVTKDKAKEDLQDLREKLKKSKKHCLQRSGSSKGDVNKMIRETLDIVRRAHPVQQAVQ